MRPPRPAPRPAVAPPRRRPVQAGHPRLIDTAGPDPSTPLERVRLVVGVIVGPFGVRGEAKLKLSTDDPERLAEIPRVWLGDEPTPRKLLGVRLHKGMALLRLQGISTPEQVDALRGVPVRIAAGDARPLVPGEFFLFQLIGLAAHDEAGSLLGTLTDVMETGAHDVFVITPAGGGADILVPNHPDYVPEILPEHGRLTVRPPVYDR